MAEFRLLEKVERLALDDELTLSKYRREGERLGQKEEPKSEEVTNINEYVSGEIQKAIAPLLAEIEHLKKEIALLKKS